MSAEDMDVPYMAANYGATSRILAGDVARTPATTPVATAALNPTRGPTRSPIRRSDEFEIFCTNDVDLAIGQGEEEEVVVGEVPVGADISDDSIDENDGVPQYMLCLERRLRLLEKTLVLEGEREEGYGGNSDEEGEEVLIHDEARVKSTEERRDADGGNQNFEDKDEKAVFLARNNMHMAVDPRMRFPEPPP
jgi:hypothetical protein